MSVKKEYTEFTTEELKELVSKIYPELNWRFDPMNESFRLFSVDAEMKSALAIEFMEKTKFFNTYYVLNKLCLCGHIQPGKYHISLMRNKHD